MATINDIAVRVLQRLEESTTAPVFWNLQQEVYPIIVEAMNEAALLTGVVQVAQTATLTLPAGTNYVAMPQNAIAILRLAGPPAVKKTDVYTLDQLCPGWENEGGAGVNPAVQQIQYWFPLGVSQFGIYPKLTVPQKVKLVYLGYPVTVSPPYTGLETVPFQTEFLDGLEEYVAHILRLKESGYEFQASQTNYQQFLTMMRDLNVFQARHDSLVFTTAAGARVRVNPVEVR